MKYKNKKVVIMGLGIYEEGSGISGALYFANEGANVLITDLRPESILEDQISKLKKFKNVKYVLGEHREADFEEADYIFKNPGVPKNSPYLEIANKNKIPIINDWTIYFEERPKNLLVGITGTKGKSTVTTLTYEILKNAKKDAVLCGNIGSSPLSLLDKINDDTIVVAELSSWLLQEFKTIRKSPQISVVTNLKSDHLDKYKSLDEYHRDKENIFKFQNKDDYLIINKDDRKLRKVSKKAKSKIIPVSGGDSNAISVEISNLLKVPKSVAKKTIKNFKGARGRLELVLEKDGTKYYNDTTATMPDATEYALNSLKPSKGKAVLIAGGSDKELDYRSFAKTVNKKAGALILFPGTATSKILEEIGKLKGDHLIPFMANNMKEAVAKAKSLAFPSDIILLSPGAASFGMFKNEFDRGTQFLKEIKK